MSDAKPPFDPSQPFTPAPESASTKPAFDPSKPFIPGRVPSIGEERAGAISTMRGIPLLGAYADRAAAAGNAALQPVIGAHGLSEAPTYGERYEENKARIKGGVDAYETQHPYLTAAGKVALGTAATAPLAATAAGARALGITGGSLTSRVAAGATTNAAIGGGDAYLRGEDPKVGAVLGGGLGAAGPIVGSAIAGATRATAGPTREALFEAGNNAYNQARALGVQFHPAAMSQLATDIGTNLVGSGHMPELVPTTHAIVGRLNRPIGNPGTGTAPATLDDLNSVRQGLLQNVQANSGLLGNRVEANASRRAIDHIENFWSNPNGVTAGNAPEAARLLTEARGNWGAARRSERIDTAEHRADLTAAAPGSGANADNATRQQFKNLALNDRRMSGFTPEETAAVENVVRGDPVSNAFRYVGKLAPTGTVSAALPQIVLAGGAGYAAHAGHPEALAIPAAGYGAKKISDMLTQRRAGLADQMVRQRSPLAAGMPQGSIADVLERIAGRSTPVLSTEANDLINFRRD